MAKKLVEGIEQELTCAVCLDRFKEPKVLPCLHTYCKGCVGAMVAKSREKDAVVCPKCRERCAVPPEGASGFLSNFPLNNLLQLLEIHETAGHGDEDSAKVLRCENGVDENVAVARCLDCCAYLCETCWELHTKGVASRSHSTVSLEAIGKCGEVKLHRKPQYCPEHEDEILKLYCKTCSMAICGDCTYIDHRDHRYVFIKDICQELRQELEGMMEGLRKKEGEFSEYLECLQRAQAEQEANVQACRQEVNRAFDSFVQRIQLCRDRVLEEVEKTAIADKKCLSAEADITEVSLAKVSSNLSFIDRLLKSGSDTEVVSMAAPTLERVKTVQGMKCEQNPDMFSGTLVAHKLKEAAEDITEDFCKHMAEIDSDLVSVAQGKTDLFPDNGVVVKGLEELSVGCNTITISVAKRKCKYMLQPFQLYISVTHKARPKEEVPLTVERTSDSSWNVSFLLTEPGQVYIRLSVDGTVAPFMRQVGYCVASRSNIGYEQQNVSTKNCDQWDPLSDECDLNSGQLSEVLPKDLSTTADPPLDEPQDHSAGTPAPHWEESDLRVGQPTRASRKFGIGRVTKGKRKVLKASSSVH